MMMYLLGLVLVTVASVQARTFNNPILGGQNYTTPSAFKDNGIYYVVTESPDTSIGLFPIHSSTDLKSWEQVGYVFDGRNTPIWIYNNSVHQPQIHKIGSFFQVFYSMHASSDFLYALSATKAPFPLNPYEPIYRPFLILDVQMEYPSFINDEDKIYLLWRNSGTSILARQLALDGNSFSSDQTTRLLEPSLTWEGDSISSTWYIRRGSYHYLLYTGGCSVGVARSSNALGPYEKLPNPIIAPNSGYECTGDVSVVKDLDDKGDIIFFTAYRTDDADKTNSVLLASVGWDADNWPYVEDF